MPNTDESRRRPGKWLSTRVDPNVIQPGPIQHQQLPPSLIARIESVRTALTAVYPMSMEQWLDGFQRDVNPEREVLWWERLAYCYTEYAQQEELPGEQRKAAFNVVCKLALGASADDLAGDLASLPRDALDQIIAMMRSSTLQ